MTGTHADSGFSMVEMLVALAIAALLAIASGSLIALGAGTKERVEDVAQIEAALVSLNSIAALAASELHDRIEVADADGFSLSGEGQPLRFDLKAKLLGLRDGDAQNQVDLAAFDTARFEYLVDEPQGGRWLDGRSTSQRELVGARLTLRHGSRTWRPLVWARPEWPRAEQ